MRALLILLLCLASAAEAADGLGRLFFTPEQRALLDFARRAEPGAAEAAAETYEGITLNGIVTRSDGPATVWINGRRTSGAAPVSSGSANISMPGGRGRVKLKVGQSLDAASGKVQEGYRRVPRESAELPPVATPTIAKPATQPREKDDEREEPVNATPQ